MISSKRHQTCTEDEAQKQHHGPRDRAGLEAVVLVLDVAQQCAACFLAAVEAEEGGVEQEEEKGFVIAQAHAPVGEPWAMVIHAEDTASTGAAVVSSVGFGCIALVAPPRLA